MLHEAALLPVSKLLTEQRQAIQHRLLAGASGDDVVAATTDLVDGLIIGQTNQPSRGAPVAERGAVGWLSRPVSRLRSAASAESTVRLRLLSSSG